MLSPDSSRDVNGFGLQLNRWEQQNERLASWLVGRTEEKQGNQAMIYFLTLKVPQVAHVERTPLWPTLTLALVTTPKARSGVSGLSRATWALPQWEGRGSLSTEHLEPVPCTRDRGARPRTHTDFPVLIRSQWMTHPSTHKCMWVRIDRFSFQAFPPIIYVNNRPFYLHVYVQI